MNKNGITVFTPTFNRGSLLKNLYESLFKQTKRPEEWIIVDDGSSDDTASIVQDFIKEAKLDIVYLYQKNGGKHRAINKGVENAKGELFFIVDSDDTLKPQALELVEFYWNSIPIDKRDFYAGVAGLKADEKEGIVGDCYPTSSYQFFDATYWDLRYKHTIRGDKAEAYRTSLLKKYPFPEFSGEKYLTEAVVWGRISNEGFPIRWFNEEIYNCEYLPDGLSSGFDKLLYKNPKGTALFYNQEQLSGTKDFRLYLNYRYYCYSILSKENIFQVIKNDNRKRWMLLGLPLGYIRSITEKIKRK